MRQVDASVCSGRSILYGADHSRLKLLDKEDGEETLEDTARNALRQIADRKYDTDLIQRGIPAERIYRYGFAFEGEKCLIRKA